MVLSPVQAEARFGSLLEARDDGGGEQLQDAHASQLRGGLRLSVDLEAGCLQTGLELLHPGVAAAAVEGTTTGKYDAVARAGGKVVGELRGQSREQPGFGPDVLIL